MLKKKWIYFIGFFVLNSFTTKHPFYLSLVEAHHNTKEQTVEISIRIFIDDFENNLAKIQNFPKQKKSLLSNIQTNRSFMGLKFNPFNYQFIDFKNKKK